MLRLLSSAVEASREELSGMISPLWNSGGADKSAGEAARFREEGNALLKSGDLDAAMRYVTSTVFRTRLDSASRIRDSSQVKGRQSVTIVLV